jgi:hypothetical protein
MNVRWDRCSALLAMLVAASGCARPAVPSQASAAASVAPPSDTTTASAPTEARNDAGTAPVAAASTAPSLLRLSQNWARDPDLTLSGNHPTDDVARCPRVPREPSVSDAALVPPPYVRVVGIATHSCDAVLWVFLACAEATPDGEACSGWRERPVLEPAAGGAGRIVADLEPVIGGNSGGLFVPFAFTRDDRWILLRAWMFSPGAGGGAVDYGVGVIARTARQERSPTVVQPLPARDLSFYDGFGCAIGLAASDQTPTYTQPGFPANNGGALVVIDLATLTPRTLLEERDTTYAVTRVDEKARTVEVEVAKHTFGKDCPREEGALSCSASSGARRRIALPACGADDRRRR